MKFAVVDVETSNERFHSICQVGIAEFEAGAFVRSHSHLIDPRQEFRSINSAIHGITEEHVQGKPTLVELWPDISALLSGKVVVSHTSFDRSSVRQASAHNDLPEIVCEWLDSAIVTRRTWAKYSQRGYGLASLAKDFNIDFRHHDAAEDARAAGEVLLLAIQHSGIDLSEWVEITKRRGAGIEYKPRTKLEGFDGGPLSGEVCVFTGGLQMVRDEAKALANNAGAAIANSVSKKTTLVVVGDQDLARLAGKSKSAKHLQAEKLASEGYPIRIIGENDFLSLLD